MLAFKQQNDCYINIFLNDFHYENSFVVNYIHMSYVHLSLRTCAYCDIVDMNSNQDTWLTTTFATPEMVVNIYLRFVPVPT